MELTGASCISCEESKLWIFFVILGVVIICIGIYVLMYRESIAAMFTRHRLERLNQVGNQVTQLILTGQIM